MRIVSVATFKARSFALRNAPFRFTVTDTTPTPDRHSDRRERSQKAILKAATELIEEVGVGGLTIEGVAARSGVAKTTIYRRWRDKDELALAILIETTAEISPPPDKGDTRKELMTFVDSATRVITSGGVVSGLVSEIATRPDLSREYVERIVEVRMAELKTVIDRGVERGDLRPDTEVRLVHELLIGPLYYRLLFSKAPMVKRHREQVVDAVLRAFAPVDGSTPSRRK